MAEATISRNGTSVTLPLLADGAGTALVARDIGKPNLSVQSTGSINPRFLDFWSGNEQFTLTGRFWDSNAYSDAISLADLIKENSNGTPLTLDINISDYDSDMTVAPAVGSDAALSLSYSPGRRNDVDVQLSLVRISELRGGTDQPASTPTASGTGPIQLTDGSTPVDLVDGVTVTRNVGRPQSVIRRSPVSVYPFYIEKPKTAYDAFELAFDITSNTVSTVNDIADLFSQRLGRSPLTLDFNGLYGMGEFNVVPDGSQALRHNRESGFQGVASIPTVNLRRVL